MNKDDFLSYPEIVEDSLTGNINFVPYGLVPVEMEHAKGLGK